MLCNTLSYFLLFECYCYTFLVCCFCGRVHKSLLQNQNYFHMYHTNLLDSGEWKNKWNKYFNSYNDPVFICKSKVCRITELILLFVVLNLYMTLGWFSMAQIHTEFCGSSSWLADQYNDSRHDLSWNQSQIWYFSWYWPSSEAVIRKMLIKIIPLIVQIQACVFEFVHVLWYTL